ncbi:carboxypeptidase O-like [Lineus longissimus]|uniref:carboxypeptidase O-like n=1 Tax=Lineus longissimus TaxID=88925 RepID=UPI002B4C4FDC
MESQKKYFRVTLKKPSSRLQRFILNILSTFVLLFITFNCCIGGDVKPRKELYTPDYNVYHNLTRIETHLTEIVDRNSNYMRLDKIYRSKENRPQLLLRISNFSGSRISPAPYEHLYSNVPKVRILLSYGEHAREFLPVESLFYLLKNLTDGLKMDRDSPGERFSRMVFSNIDLFIVALVNPDGREYVERTKNYCWRGTGTGVDLNRNFDWEFAGKGSSGNKHDEEYRGPFPLSEPESRVLVDLTAKYEFDAFISLHSGIKQIYIPYADTKSQTLHRKPDNIERMIDLASLLSHSTSHHYRYGLAYELNDYTADGCVFDYMAGKRKIPFSLAIEMWGDGDLPGTQCFDLFNPRSENLVRDLKEIHPLYDTLFIYLIRWKMEKMAISMDPEKEAPSLTFGLLLLGVVVLITFIFAIHKKLPPWLRMFPRRRVVSLRTLSSAFPTFS